MVLRYSWNDIGNDFNGEEPFHVKNCMNWYAPLYSESPAAKVFGHIRRCPCTALALRCNRLIFDYFFWLVIALYLDNVRRPLSHSQNLIAEPPLALALYAAAIGGGFLWQILPQSGTLRKTNPFFCCMPSYWCGKGKIASSDGQAEVRAFTRGTLCSAAHGAMRCLIGMAGFEQCVRPMLACSASDAAQLGAVVQMPPPSENPDVKRVALTPLSHTDPEPSEPCTCAERICNGRFKQTVQIRQRRSIGRVP